MSVLTPSETYQGLTAMQSIQASRRALCKMYVKAGRVTQVQRIKRQYDQDQIKITSVLKALKNSVK